MSWTVYMGGEGGWVIRLQSCSEKRKIGDYVLKNSVNKADDKPYYVLN